MNEEQFERFMGIMASIQSDLQKISSRLEDWDIEDGHSALNINNV